MRRFVLMLTLIAGCALTVHAQNSAASNLPSSLIAPPTSARSVQDDPVAKALEQAVNRLAVAEEKNRLLEARLEAKDATIAAKDGLIAVKDEQFKLALSANKDRAGANTIDQFRVEACQTQLAKADAEIHRLRNPPFFKRLFSTETVGGFALGYGVKSLQK